MATYAENLQTAKEAIATELALGNVKPTYNLDGQMVDWNGYRESLCSELERLNALIAQAAGPAEVITEGRV